MALGAARRDEERRLFISILGTMPHPESAEALLPHLGSETLKEEAGQALVRIGAAWKKSGDAAGAAGLAEKIEAAGVSEEVRKRAGELR